MNKFWTVFQFHLKENLRAKSFLIFTSILFLLVLGFLGFSHFINDEKKIDIKIVNETEQYVIDEETMNNEQSFAEFEIIEDGIVEKTKDSILEGDTDGLIILRETNERPSIEYFYPRFPNGQLINYIQNHFQQQHITFTAKQHSLSSETIQTLLTPVSIETVALNENNNIGLVYFFVILMYMFIITFGQTISMSISGEKATRVMEIMITKAPPLIMMGAKIFATLITGILQIFAMVMAYLLAKSFGWTEQEGLNLFGMPMDISLLNGNLIFFFVLYFVLGYMVYAFLFAALGSLVSRTEDAASTFTPVIILVVMSFLLGIKTMNDPNAPIILIATYIPFFSPIVTFARIVLEEAGMLEILLTTFIITVTSIVIGILSSKVYVKGIHTYQNKNRFSDFFKVLKEK